MRVDPSPQTALQHPDRASPGVDARLLETLWAAPVALAAFDAQGRLLRANRALCELAALPEAELSGRRLADAVPQLAAAAEALARVLATGEPEAAVPLSLGCRALSGSFHAARDAKGAVSGAWCVLAPLPPEPADQQTRLAGEVLRQMPAGVIVRRADGTTFSNDRLRRMLGGPAKELQDEPAMRRADGRPYGPGETPVRRSLLRAETVQGEEVLYAREDGEEAVLRVNATPVRDEAGRVQASVGVLEDVTVRRRLEEERAKLLSLLESSSDLIGVASLDGRPLYLNEAGRRLLGLQSQEDALSRTLPSFIAEEDVRRAFDEIQPSLLAGQRFRGELTLRSFDTGEPIPVELVAFAIEGRDGKPSALAAVCRDIRARQHAEELQRQLVGIVSHDLRSPLTAIVMAADLLLAAEDLPRRHRETAARIHASGERMRRLIGDLLDYQQARVGGGLPLSRKRCELGRICIEAVQELLLGHAGREVIYEPGDEGQGSFDADRLTQLLHNLLGNALAHSPTGTPVRLSWRGDGPALRIDVHNQGEPIPPEFMPQLFQPFRRGKAQGEGRQGFGLGLFIVHEIVRAHGGSIEVASAEDAGTTFTVRLPRT